MSDKKTIALELQPCCGKRSGIGVYAYELTRNLQKDDAYHYVGNIFNFLGRNNNDEALKGINIPIKENHIFPYGVYRRIWRLLPADYEDFFPVSADLYVFYNYIAPPRIRGRMISTIHDMTYLRYPKTVDQKNLRRINSGINSTVERSSCILTVSEFSKREIQELLNLPEDKIDVVPNAPSVTNELCDYESLRKRWNIRDQYLLYVGTIEPRKNLSRLINAFTILKGKYHIPHKLVLAGGKGWNLAEFENTLAATPNREDIILTGYVTAAEKNTLYCNADAFVFPSLYEGFGIPPLEAMCWGCPVISSNAASLPEVCGDAAEYVEPQSVESIAEGIWNVLSDQNRKNELIELGNRRKEHYSWQASTTKLKEIIQRVL